MPEPIMTMSALEDRVRDFASTREGKGGSSCQNEDDGLGTGRPGGVLMRERVMVNSVFSAERV